MHSSAVAFTDAVYGGPLRERLVGDVDALCGDGVVNGEPPAVEKVGTVEFWSGQGGTDTQAGFVSGVSGKQLGRRVDRHRGGVGRGGNLTEHQAIRGIARRAGLAVMSSAAMGFW
jgi:hypothetical protein